MAGNANAAAGPSRLPGPSRGRVSIFGNNAGVKSGGINFQPFAIPLPVSSTTATVTADSIGEMGAGARLSGEIRGNPSRMSNGGNSTVSVGLGMTEEEIDERVSFFLHFQFCFLDLNSICRSLKLLNRK